MALRLIDETAAQTVLEISGGGALIGIGGAADSVQILSVCGNPIIRSDGICYNNTVVATSGGPVSGVASLDGSGNATISTGLSEPVIEKTSGSLSLVDNSAGSFQLHGAAGGTREYCYW